MEEHLKLSAEKSIGVGYASWFFFHMKQKLFGLEFFLHRNCTQFQFI